MNTDFKPSGIAGMTGRPSFGASVQIGRRYGSSNVPVEKDRFHIMTSHETGLGRREPAPGFDFWNVYPRSTKGPDGAQVTEEQVRAEVLKRTTIHGVIVHGSWDYAQGGCLQQHWSAQTVKNKMAPGRLPACQGDGVRARRYYGEKGRDDWRMIDGCGETCPFTKRVGKDAPECRPLTRFAFRLDWTGTPAAGKAPTPVVRFASKGWKTYASFLGFRQSFEDQARLMGLDPATVPPFGLRFRMSVIEVKGEGTRYQAVEIVTTDSPADHIASVMRTLSDTRRLAAASPLLQIGDDDFVADLNSLEGPS